MIKVNRKELELNHFPDGTLHLAPTFVVGKVNNIIWKYENEEELIALIYIANYLKEHGGEENTLYMPYIPNARMDRVKNKEDVFTLKYFANIINSLGFKQVKVLDPHSSVSEALINNLSKIDLESLINDVLCRVIENNCGDIVIYFPDSGAYKKYEEIFNGKYPTCYGIKHRNWKTGKIEGLEVITNGIDLKDKTVLMVDDICSYGTTIWKSAEALNKLGVKCIYAYVSHCENSILDGNVLKCGLIKRVFTTNSIFSSKHDLIDVIDI